MTEVLEEKLLSRELCKAGLAGLAKQPSRDMCFDGGRKFLVNMFEELELLRKTIYVSCFRKIALRHSPTNDETIPVQSISNSKCFTGYHQ